MNQHLKPLFTSLGTTSFLMMLALLFFIQGCGVLKWSEVKRAEVASDIRSTAVKQGGSSSSSTTVNNSGSSSNKPTNSGGNTEKTPFTGSLSRSEKSIQSKLLEVYSDWKGTPYKWGGSTKKAIDCSAFMQRTFEEGFGKQLPRTTQEQYVVGKKIDKKALQTGDLVFFKTGTNTWHVGVYLSDEQFMHASVTYGVSVTDLSNPYWKRRYIGARRLL